eukprot:515206-Amphidinium_carterae.1
MTLVRSTPLPFHGQASPNSHSHLFFMLRLHFLSTELGLHFLSTELGLHFLSTGLGLHFLST